MGVMVFGLLVGLVVEIVGKIGEINKALTS